MEIHIKRGQEPRTGFPASGDSIRFTLEVSVAFSQVETGWLTKYRDLSIVNAPLIKHEQDSDFKAAYPFVKIDQMSRGLSGFRLVAHVDDHRYIDYLDQLASNLSQGLKSRFIELKKLGHWYGETTITN